ncbi:MAG: FAD-dependent oxidoreductase [Clostridia bacterium]|nr:FAD-dependent oxidoreductase [Clostridia bacterium]MDR3645108.1 FAD-dependent oxidoreductase [Clostridia bacterium]
MNYVVIGNSAAAVGCVEGIRKVDATGAITLISDESHRAYSRPLISYWLSGKVDDERMYYRNEDFYEKNHVKTLLGVRVTALDAAAKTVTLSDGTVLPYDSLMVATGSRPFVPPIAGVQDCPQAVTFLDWDSARRLKGMVNKKSRVVVLGAGLIGLKVTEGLAGHVAGITVVEMAAHLMPSVLDDDSAAMLQRHIEKNGVSFIYEDPAAKVSGNLLTLGSGRELAFDVLVLAAGVRPNVELVRDAGGTVNRGIIVNSFMQTSLPDVYAAGDCVEAMDVVSGARKIMALLPNAYMQGEAAGKTMAGAPEGFEKSMPMNAIGFFGMPLCTAGDYDGEAYVKIEEDSFKKLFFKDDRLVGYILISDVDRAGIYTALIREKVDLKGVDLELLRQRPQLMLFSNKADRKRIVAGGSITQ